MYKRRSGSRTSSVATRPKLQRQSVKRSFSYPTEALHLPAIATISSSLPDSGLFSDHPHQPLHSLGIQTDPVPLSTRSSAEPANLPRALVISGLENVQGLSQRALLKVLSEKQVVLDDNDENWICKLPPGFIVIYVCAADPRERPEIHKSLVSTHSD